MKVGPGPKFMLPFVGMDPTKKTPKGFCLKHFLKKVMGVGNFGIRGSNFASKKGKMWLLWSHCGLKSIQFGNVK